MVTLIHLNLSRSRWAFNETNCVLGLLSLELSLHSLSKKQFD